MSTNLALGNPCYPGPCGSVCDQRCRFTCRRRPDESTPLYNGECVGRFETKDWSSSQNVWCFITWTERQKEEIGIEQCKQRAIGLWKATSGFREKVSKILGRYYKLFLSSKSIVENHTVCSFLNWAWLGKAGRLKNLLIQHLRDQALKEVYVHLQSELKLYQQIGF